jgi:hypothetical protein
MAIWVTLPASIFHKIYGKSLNPVVLKVFWFAAQIFDRYRIPLKVKINY